MDTAIGIDNQGALTYGYGLEDIDQINDADVYNVDEDKGIFRANKIIVTNPRKITDEMVIDLYKKSTLSDKIIAQCLLTLINYFLKQRKYIIF